MPEQTDASTRAGRKNEQVYGQLHALILSGTLAPGARIVTDRVAAQFGMSPIPVREALSRLEAEGFIVSEPNVGAKVSELHPENVHEVFELLSALELICGRSACLMLNDADLVWIETLLVEMAGSADDPDTWSAQNKELHLFIGDKSGRKLARRMLSSALDHWDRLRRHFLDDVFLQRIPVAHAEHLEMFGALQERNPKRLEAVVRQHNEVALRAYLSHMAVSSRRASRQDANETTFNAQAANL